MFVGASRAEAFGREQVDDVRFVIQSSSESHQRRVGLVEVVYNNNVTLSSSWNLNIFDITAHKAA